MAKASIAVREFGSNWKASSVNVHAANLTAGTFTAQETAAIAFKDAVAAVCLGGIGALEIAHEADNDGLVAPTAEQAQRENKWLVSCRESTSPFLPVTFTIPCPDLELLDANGEDMEAGAERTALESAVAAYVKSNRLADVTVESIKFRGRTI